MRIRVLTFTLAATAVLAIPATAAAPRTFRATLNGRSEVPKTTSHAKGAAVFTIAKNGKSIAYTLKATGLSGKPQAAHIHLGKKGQAGGVMIAISTKPFTLPKSGKLTSKQFSATGSATTFAKAIKAIRAGNTYVNIHTKKFPAGEIRGQVVK